MLFVQLVGVILPFLAGFHQWGWDRVGDFWSWAFGLVPWFQSLGYPWQIGIAAAYLLFGVYLAWENNQLSANRMLAFLKRTFVVVLWLPLLGVAGTVSFVVLFYSLWLTAWICLFVAAAVIMIYEVPIRFIAGLLAHN